MVPFLKNNTMCRERFHNHNISMAMHRGNVKSSVAILLVVYSKVNGLLIEFFSGNFTIKN